MTIFGKILTFVILVLALAQAGLHVMFHIAQSKYEIANKNLTQSNQGLTAEVAALTAERDRYRAEKDTAVTEAQSKADQAITQTNAIKAEKAELLTQIDKLTAQIQLGLGNLAKSNEAVKLHTAEVDNMKTWLTDRDSKIRQLLELNNQLRTDEVKSRIEAKDFKVRNETLVFQLEESQKELAKREKMIAQLKADRSSGVASGAGSGGNVGGMGAGGLAGMKNPPPVPNLEGIVTANDANNGLIKINLGSDSGIDKNHTLEVFRLNPPKYLGTIRIMTVTPNEAVGKPITKPLAPIQQGHHVASEILGT